MITHPAGPQLLNADLPAMPLDDLRRLFYVVELDYRAAGMIENPRECREAKRIVRTDLNLVKRELERRGASAS